VRATPQIVWAGTDTSLGAMILAGSGDVLVGAWFAGQEHFSGPGAGWREVAGWPVLDETASQIAEYLAGRRRVFTVPLAPEGTAFQQEVWVRIREIPFGCTAEYGEVASALGKPGAARAVGAATGRNPVSILVPCHRMVGRGGALTGYAGGLHRKRALLRLEGVLL
jgi:methylated-DNA-[protein]-cysteine S-methyltransferase